MKLLTANQMREYEQRADAGGNSYATMMTRAGKAVADAIIARLDVRDANVIVLVGPGNNGGDGLVVARLLHDAGARVWLYVWKRVFKDDDENLQLCFVRNIPLMRVEEDPDFYELEKFLGSCDLIVDALLGTGVARPIQGALKALLETVSQKTSRPENKLAGLIPTTQPTNNPTRPFIVAVDLPSGLNPDTGTIDPSALAADLTVTFAFPKLGHLIFPGAETVGELVIGDIGIPHEWANEIPLDVATPPEIAALLPARPRDSHKGTHGKAMICAGSLNYTGAAYLSATAATRAGAGLVTLALARTIYPIIASAAHEPTFVPLPDADGVLIPSAAKILRDALNGYNVLLIGPGFGRDERTVAFVRNVIASPVGAKQSPRRNTEIASSPNASRLLAMTLPHLIIDADALYALAQTQDWWTHLAPNSAILTPHPGEMATLCGMTRDEIQADRIGIAKKFAQQWNQVVVLKGAHTVVAAPDGRITLIPFATPALATAGTGDVLAGTITAMLAQGLDIYDAAIVGAYVHGCAGKIAEEEIGRAGVVAGDLLTRLPIAINRIQE